MDNDELLIAIKDMFENKVEEVKQHTGVLVEKLESDVKAIAEGHSILNNKIDEMKEEILGMKTEISGMKTEISGMKTEISGLKAETTIVKNYVIGVDTKLNEHEIILKRVK